MTLQQQSKIINANFKFINDNVTALQDKVKDIELFKFPNATIIGAPHIESGQVSNFSTENYLQFPFIVDMKGRPFEIDFVFTTGTDVTTQQNIIDSQFGLALAIKEGKGLMAISSNGTSWDLGATAGTATIEASTTYWAKLTWDGQTYKTSISTDGTTYTEDITVASNKGPFPRTILIGGGSQAVLGHTPTPFKGTINLNKAYLYISGLLIWQGMDDAGLATRATVSLDNLNSSGEARFNAKANDTAVVHRTGDETVAGTKTFSTKIKGSIENADASTTAKRPDGFATNPTDFWGVINATAKTGTIVNSGRTSAGASYIYSERGTGDKSLDFIVDGKFFQDEGQYEVIDSSTGVTHTKSTAVGSATTPVYVAADGKATAITPATAPANNSANLLTAGGAYTEFSKYNPQRYGKVSISTYAAAKPYIKLASVSFANTNNYDFASLFWVESQNAGTSKDYALVRLTARWGSTTFGGCKFEILEKYGDNTDVFNDLTFAYKYESTATSSGGKLTAELWMKTRAANWCTYYMRPTECNEYGDYTTTTVSNRNNPWVYENKGGTSEQVAAASITEGLTKVIVHDASTQLALKEVQNNITEMALVKAPNIISKGSMSANGSILRNFSNSSFAQLPFYFNPSSKKWALDVCVKTGSNVTSSQMILDSEYGLEVALLNSKFILRASSNGTSWDLGEVTGTTTVKANTVYNLKVAYTGTNYTLSIDEGALTTEEFLAPEADGSESNYRTTYSFSLMSYFEVLDSAYTKEAEITAAAAVHPATLYLGGKGGDYFLGEIDLSACLLKVDGTPIWQGLDTCGLETSADTSLSNLDAEGQAKFDAKANVEDIPTKVSELENDSNYLVASDIAGKQDIVYCEQTIGTTKTTIVAPYLKACWVDGAKGYNIWSNGYCEQWGRDTVNVGARLVVTLEKTFKDTNYNTQGVLAALFTTSAESAGCGVVPTSESTITLVNGYSEARAISWKVCGYLAEGQY